MTAYVPESACQTVQSLLPQVEEMIWKFWLEFYRLYSPEWFDRYMYSHLD